MHRTFAVEQVQKCRKTLESKIYIIFIIYRWKPDVNIIAAVVEKHESG